MKPMMKGAAISSKSDAKESIDLSQISLRPMDLSYLDDFILWTSDEGVTRFSGLEPYTSKEDSINFLQKMASNALWFKAIFLGDCAIGCVHLASCSGQGKIRDKVANVGLILSSKYWGKGIAVHVLKQAAEVAFKEFTHLERLEGMPDVENVASQRAVEKAGFQREGVLRKYIFIGGKSRDVVMSSIIKSPTHPNPPHPSKL